MTHNDKLAALANLIQAQTKDMYAANYPNTPANCLEMNTTVHIRPAKKYTKIDVGTSGKYMVVNETGEIFGIKGYGIIHRGHQYGTLDTIQEWYWGNYRAKKIA